jgi:cytochrome c biogenesis factor
MGGRAMESTAALLLLSVCGLGYALVTVQLQYAIVSAYSGFQEPWYWRLAALWSGPPAGVLVLTLLLAIAGAVSSRLGRSRFVTARTGALAVIALIGTLTVVARTQPFVLSDVPAHVGAGLPLAAKAVPWQVEVVSTYLAIACGAFAFACVVSEQLTESRDIRQNGRVALTAATGLLTLSIMAVAWRVYGDSGRLLDVTSVSFIAVHLPAWLVAFAYLHAPAGPAVPAWADKWSRTLAVAFFPTAVGAGAALIAGMGDVPLVTLWAGGLAVGILSGAFGGMSRRPARFEQLRRVPGFGAWAFQAGLFLLIGAGLTAVWGLVRGPIVSNLAWPVVLLGLAAAAAWASVRPAGAWRRVWPASLGLSGLVTIGVYVATGSRYPEMALAAGLAIAVLVGLVADVVRLREAHRSFRTNDPNSSVGRVVARRSWRRGSSALAHLGAALLVLGLSAEAMTEVHTQPMIPGDAVGAKSGLAGKVTVTYLGLSRYQVDALDKRVASFSISDGDDREMMTAAMTYDLSTRRQYRTPALKRGLLGDVVVGITGRSGSEEGIVCSVASRPLASLVWFGGLLIFASVFVRRRMIA